ncbi:MAG TPA: TolC family protein [Polyangiaceae bacterium]|jgi:outer membrane protein TolC|nr:TolC family protein [Polyangiaceae bacterium]
MTRTGSAVLLVALLASVAHAEEAGTAVQPPVRALSLDEALAYARAHQPAVRAAVARIQAQAAQAKIPSSQWYPTIGATAQVFAATANNTTGTYVSSRDMDIPRIGATRATGTGSWRPYPSTLVGLGFNQELFDFGRIAAQSAAEDAATDVERQRARAVTLDVSFDVEEAYFSVFAAKAVLKASQDAYDRSLVHRDLARAGVGSGLRSPIELTRAEADLANFEIGRIRAQGGLVTAQTVFAATVGVEDPALDVSSAPPTPADLPDLSHSIARAEAKDPRLLEVFAELRATEQRTRAIGAELRPNLSITGTISGRAGDATPSGNGTLPNGSGLLPTVPNWDVGAVLSWPLFDGTISAREDASRAREQARREDIGVVREQDRAAVREAYSNVGVAQTVLPGLHRAEDAARANYAQADARFKAGLGTSVELADAEALRAEAEIQLALGEFQLARARAAFGRTIAEGF